MDFMIEDYVTFVERSDRIQSNKRQRLVNYNVSVKSLQEHRFLYLGGVLPIQCVRISPSSDGVGELEHFDS